MTSNGPTQAENFFFDTNGYLVLENFLAPDHVEALTERLIRVVEHRRRLEAEKVPHHGKTQIDGGNTRIFHILEDDPAFLELVDYAPLMPYVHALLNEAPHFHASDAFLEIEPKEGKPGWHIDGGGKGFRLLRPRIPHLQLKVAYFLSDMSAPNQANLTLVPGSHKADFDPDPEGLQGFDDVPGATQVCVPPGSTVLFHNAVWHTRGPFSKPDGKRIVLYYAYEHPWMLANPEHWSYSKDFYEGLSEQRRELFHEFVFDRTQK